MKSSYAILFLTTNLIFFVTTNACFPGCNIPTKPGNPNPTPTPSTPSTQKCPRDALKLGVCANLLNGAVGAVVGAPPTTPCCSMLGGLLDLEVALCLCTALKANILGINLNIPIALSLLIDSCGKSLPSDFQCA